MTAADARLPDACFTGRPDRLAIWQALQAYSKWGWPVSEDKVVSDTTTDTVLGGEVDGEVGSVGSPMGRRFVLMILLLYASRLQWVSAYLVESLLGNVTFSFLFRRPLLAVLQTIFSSAEDDRSKLRPLSRAAAGELTLAALLLPLAQSDLRAPALPGVWSVDASPDGGGITHAAASSGQARELFRLREKRGGYSKLESPARCALREQGLLGRPGSSQEEALFPAVEDPRRPLAFVFDFLEVFAGSAILSTAVSRLGISVGPPIEIRVSRWYDLTDTRVCEWLIWLVTERRIRCASLAPPCTTFSVAASTAPRRSKLVPRGFDPRDPATWLGNRLADLSLFLVGLCRRHGIGAMAETPGASRLQHLPAWKRLAALPDCQEYRLDSCAFGCPSRKPFVILSALIFFRERAAIDEGMIAERAISEEAWVFCWMVALALTVFFNAWLVSRKSRREGRPFFSPGLKMGLRALLPSLQKMQQMPLNRNKFFHLKENFLKNYLKKIQCLNKHVHLDM